MVEEGNASDRTRATGDLHHRLGQLCRLSKAGGGERPDCAPPTTLRPGRAALTRAGRRAVSVVPGAAGFFNHYGTTRARFEGKTPGFPDFQALREWAILGSNQ